MARTRIVSAFLAILFLIFSAPVVWAQTADPATIRVLERLATAVEGLSGQRQAQAPPAAPAQPAAPALTHTAPASQVGPADYLTREEWNQFLAGDFSKVKRDIQSLKGRIAPRQDAPAPAAPKATGPVASANSTGPARVKMTAPAAEEFLSVAFAGDIPSQADLVGIEGYMGRYEVAQVIVLPAPGKDDAERAIHAAARAAALRAAYRAVPPGLRDPKDAGERDDLVRGAPRDAGVVFHLKLKTTTTAATP